MVVSDVIQIIRDVNAKTGQKVNSNLLRRTGNARVYFWITTHYPSFVEFVRAHNLYDYCIGKPKKWTKEYIIGEIQRVYAEHGRANAYFLQQNGLGTLLNKATSVFGDYRSACEAAGFDYDKDIMSANKIGQLRIGDKFESIVRIVFNELMPRLIYKYRNSVYGISPDWYDPQSNTVYDAKLSPDSLYGMDKFDAYLDFADKLVIVYYKPNSRPLKQHPKIEYVHIKRYVEQLQACKQVEVWQLLQSIAL